MNPFLSGAVRPLSPFLDDASSGHPTPRQLAHYIPIVGHAVDFLRPRRRSFDLLRGRQNRRPRFPDVSYAPPPLPSPLAFRPVVMHVHDELMS